MNQQTAHDQSNQRLTWIVMGAVGIWGSLLALGALLFGRDPQTGTITFSINPLRGLIVFSCVGIFLGFWAAMLAVRARRTKEDLLERVSATDQDESDEEFHRD